MLISFWFLANRRTSIFVSPWLGLLSLGRGGLHNTIFAGFRLREKVIPLHCLRRLNTSFILVLVDLPFSLSYELPALVLLVEIRRACFRFPENALVFSWSVKLETSCFLFQLKSLVKFNVFVVLGLVAIPFDVCWALSISDLNFY